MTAAPLQPKMTRAEDRATLGSDPSADSGAGTTGAAVVRPVETFWRESGKSREREGSALAKAQSTGRG